MAPWNESVDRVVSAGCDFRWGDAFPFRWTQVDGFPHPTHRGGSHAAYRAFGLVLADFFDHYGLDPATRVRYCGDTRDVSFQELHDLVAQMAMGDD